MCFAKGGDGNGSETERTPNRGSRGGRLREGGTGHPDEGIAGGRRQSRRDLAAPRQYPRRELARAGQPRSRGQDDFRNEPQRLRRAAASGGLYQSRPAPPVGGGAGI